MLDDYVITFKYANYSISEKSVAAEYAEARVESGTGARVEKSRKTSKKNAAK